jgi:hypothetical protein
MYKVMEHNIMGLTKPQNKKFIYMGDTIFWFLKGNKEHIRKFLKWWFGSYKI